MLTRRSFLRLAAGAAAGLLAGKAGKAEAARLEAPLADKATEGETGSSLWSGKELRFDGRLVSVAIWDTALTAEEIESITHPALCARLPQLIHLREIWQDGPWPKTMIVEGSQKTQYKEWVEIGPEWADVQGGAFTIVGWVLKDDCKTEREMVIVVQAFQGDAFTSLALVPEPPYESWMASSTPNDETTTDAPEGWVCCPTGDPIYWNVDFGNHWGSVGSNAPLDDLPDTSGLTIDADIRLPTYAPDFGEENRIIIPFHHFTDFYDENGEHHYAVNGVPVSEWSESEVRRVLTGKGLL